mmetsp:Transcript_83844/g.218283  ORF Transcript_83844/g.218283 Transcript_83844/m.218283 type:complete len:672 (-) Transcript_83844:235-2250(-)
MTAGTDCDAYCCTTSAQQLAREDLAQVFPEVQGLTDKVEASLRSKLEAMQSEVIGEVVRETHALFELWVSGLAAAPALSVVHAPKDDSKINGELLLQGGGMLTDLGRLEPESCSDALSDTATRLHLPSEIRAPPSKWRSAGLADVDGMPFDVVNPKLLSDAAAEAATGIAALPKPGSGAALTLGMMADMPEHEIEEPSIQDTVEEKKVVIEEDSDESRQMSKPRKMMARMSTTALLASVEQPDALGWMGRVITSWGFELVSSVLILANCATMGIQAHEDVTGDLGASWIAFLDFTEHFFTAFFLVECILRFWVYGWRGFSLATSDGRSNFLDACLVIFTGVVNTWVIPLVAFLLDSRNESGFLRTLTVFRAVRLVRLVRVFRKIPVFHEAWMLLSGLRDSARTLFWTIVVIFFVTYGFAIFGIKLIVEPLQIMRATTTDPEVARHMDSFIIILDGLDKLMFTLVQVLCEDSFHAFMRDIMHFVPWSWMYFYSYVAIACLVLMNLVTAIIVEHAMETSKSDQEQQLREKVAKQAKEMKELSHLFNLMDTDGSGTLNWEEFKESFQDPEMKKMWRLLDFQPDDCKEVFRLLDDGDGEIETGEFFEGLSRMKGLAQAKHVYALQRSLDKMKQRMEELIEHNGFDFSRQRSPASPKSPVWHSTDRPVCFPGMHVS